jgi:hypothetical protein
MDTIITGDIWKQVTIRSMLFILLFILPRAARICYKVGLHEQNPDIP